jgi:hypothetical protein
MLLDVLYLILYEERLVDFCKFRIKVLFKR